MQDQREKAAVFQLTPSLIQYINRHLPKGYSLQHSIKALKNRDIGRKVKQNQEIQSSQPKRVQHDSSKRQKVKEIKMPKGLDEDLRKCYKVLQILKRHECAFPFLEPVDPVALKIPDYPTIVKEPMDLGTIQMNFQKGQYVTKNQFLADINKIWLNSYKYNQKGSQIYRMTVQMEKHFIKLSNEEKEQEPKPVEKKQSHKHQTKAVTAASDTPLSIAEKRTLGQQIRKLPPKYLIGVWNIVRDEEAGNSNEMLEFDIDTLPVRKCRQLQEYVRGIMQNQHFRVEIAKPAAPESDESSFSVSQS